MKKATIGVLLGAAVYFFVGMIEWMVIPWHDPVMKRLPEETLIRDTLKVTITEPGMYVIPSQKGVDGRKLDMKTFEETYRSGPTGVLFFSQEGKPPMGAKNFVVEIATALLMSAFSFFLLVLTREAIQSFWAKVVLIGGLGAIHWAACYLALWNWFHMPMDFAGIILLDMMLVYLALGLVLAPFSKSS